MGQAIATVSVFRGGREEGVGDQENPFEMEVRSVTQTHPSVGFHDWVGCRAVSRDEMEKAGGMENLMGSEIPGREADRKDGGRRDLEWVNAG